MLRPPSSSPSLTQDELGRRFGCPAVWSRRLLRQGRRTSRPNSISGAVDHAAPFGPVAMPSWTWPSWPVPSPRSQGAPRLTEARGYQGAEIGARSDLARDLVPLPQRPGLDHALVHERVIADELLGGLPGPEHRH